VGFDFSHSIWPSKIRVMERPFSAYQGDDPYVFVCYGHEDSSSVYPEIKRLHDAGVHIWYDEGISPGSRWSDEIARALSEASLVLFFCTSHSIESQHCQDEINFALDEKRPLLVVQDRAVDLPPGLRLRLGSQQAILKYELSAEQFVDKLTTAVRRHLSPESVVAFNKRTTAHRAGIPDKSIAVLPFKDMSERGDQEYFADGMAEEIVNLLGKVPDLLVSARTSSFCFKEKRMRISDIARELGVAHVLEGSIRRSEDHLRVTAQLVRADNDYHVWSETYHRELRDVFALQDEIANAVVQALQIKLMGGELNRLKGGTQNLEAYQLYLRAVGALNLGTTSALDTAGEYLEQAIELDPSYGIAWSKLATTVGLKVGIGSLDPTVGYERVRQLTQHALELSPTNAEAHARLAAVNGNYYWDWAAAEIEAQRALAIDPTNPDALRTAAALSYILGHWDDAVRQYRRALVRDPLNTSIVFCLGMVHYKATRLTEAEAAFRKVLELAPRFLGARHFLGMTLLAQGRANAALAAVLEEVDEEFRSASLPVLLHAVGRNVESEEALNTLVARCGDRAAYCVAATHAYRGERDIALEWLERAREQKDPDLLGILGDPLFKTMVDEPRYEAFLLKMKLPVRRSSSTR
jgi:TolB-like protein/Tfp pilus assembly protein PilF